MVSKSAGIQLDLREPQKMRFVKHFGPTSYLRNHLTGRNGIDMGFQKQLQEKKHVLRSNFQNSVAFFVFKNPKS